jgi:hypothetical protein
MLPAALMTVSGIPAATSPGKAAATAAAAVAAATGGANRSIGGSGGISRAQPAMQIDPHVLREMSVGMSKEAKVELLVAQYEVSR